MIKRFNRYELKYIVDPRRYRNLVDDLMNFMVPDAHGDADGFYRVVSLYYDSPDLSAYWSKLDGLKFRRKLRLRIYPGNDIRKVTTGFVEIKQRTNRTVQKRRVILPRDQAERLCAGDQDIEGLDEDDRATASEVAYMIRAQSLKPKCVVSYRRRAFMGSRYEIGMRLTFDMQLQGRIHGLKVNEATRNQYVIPPDWLIMEVKVNERIPAWMVAVLGKHECQLKRVSKYCAALAHGVGRRHAAWKNRQENLHG